MAAKGNKPAKAKAVRRSREELLEEARARVAKLENADREKDRRQYTVLTNRLEKLVVRRNALNDKISDIESELKPINDRLEGYVSTDGVGEA